MGQAWTDGQGGSIINVSNPRQHLLRMSQPTTWHTSEGPRGDPTWRLGGRMQILAWAAWLVLATLAAALVVAGVPDAFAHDHVVCAPKPCSDFRLTPSSVRVLMQHGLSLDVYAAWLVSLNVALAAVFAAVAAVIAWRRSAEPMALLAAFTLLTTGTTFGNNVRLVAVHHPAWHVPVAVFSALGVVGIALFFYLFPDGRFVPGWTRVLAVAWAGWQLPADLFPRSAFDADTWPPVLFVLAWASFFCSMLFAQIYRYRRVSGSVQRQQTKWVVLGVTVALVTILVVTIVGASPLAGPNPFARLAAVTLLYSAFACIPVSIGIAILRYHLWDIDLVINRTLVYGALTTSVIGIYVLIVGGIGALLQTQGNPVLSLLAAGLVAVLFQPLRTRLQRGVNHLMYGERDEPYTVVARLGQRLENALAPDEILPTIVETVTEALKLPYAAIALRQHDGLAIVASSGAATNGSLHLPLVYQNDMVGELLLAPRAPGETFTAADERLLRDLARHAGIAAHAVRLTSELQRVNADLQRSRAHLVTTREEERRRLRRDLHDGLGAALTGLTFGLDTASNLLSRDPDVVRGLLHDLKTQAQAAIADIRHLVYDLRPPTLDELGLAGALREQVSHYQLDGTQVALEVPEVLPPLPAAVEVAAYRIVLEALANVVRHAQARTCTIHLAVSGNALTVEVRDDGVGLPPDSHAGVGMTAMRERASELGGSVTVESIPTGGTCVTAQLPLVME